MSRVRTGRPGAVVAALFLAACTGSSGGAAPATPQASPAVAPATVTASSVTVSPPSAAPAALVSRPCDTSPTLPSTDCYWLEVPERRDVAGARTIHLWVAVVHGSGAASGALPEIGLTGGPGYPASTPFVSGNITIVGAPGDLVVLDQRGIGRSVPRLDCPELDAQLDATHTWADRVDHANSAAALCRARFVQQGIDLDGYDSVESAADIVALRKALGYAKWTVTGSSYGGRVAREVYRQDPDGVAGLVLDSAVTTAPAGPANLVGRAADAVLSLAAACAAQPVCAETNGDFAANLATAAARLDAHPHVVPAADGGSPLTLTAADLYNGLLQALKRSELVPLLPGLGAALASGDDSGLDAMVSALVSVPAADPRDDFATGASAVMVCADEAASFSDADRRVLMDPGEWSGLVINEPAVTCATWAVDPVPGGHLSMVSGNVPVLAVNGSLDPATPPSFADEIRAQFPAATTLVYPGAGHLVLFMNDCATSIAIAFYDSPAAPLDASCIAAVPFPEFT